MLKNIIIKNFKSYSNQKLALAPLTLMIGANASGKSNALEAFRFLSWLSEGQKLTVLKHRVDDSDQVLRGQLKDLGYLDSTEFTLGCQQTIQIGMTFKYQFVFANMNYIYLRSKLKVGPVQCLCIK